MVHLSSPQRIFAMTIFSILTFFVTPLITTPHIGPYTKDPCVFGFLIGFSISCLIWHFYIRKNV